MRRRYAVCSEGIILFAHFFYVFICIVVQKMYTLERIYTKPLDLAIFFEHSEMAAHFGIARWSFQEYNTRIVHCNTVIYLTIYLSISIHIYIYLYIYVYCIYVFIDRSFYRVFIKNSVFLNSLQPIPCV